MFLYQFIKNFGVHISYIRDIPKFPFESMTYLLPLTLLLVATIAFWKRKKIGWILLTIFLTYSAVNAIWLLFQSYNWRPSGYGVLDNLFPEPSPAIYITKLLFVAGTLYVLSKKDMREVFSIDNQKMVTTIGITGLVTFVLMFSIF
jgi:hypothetical protein